MKILYIGLVSALLLSFNLYGQYEQKIPEKPEVILVTGGKYIMGCTTEQEKACDSDEKPAHAIELDDFSVGKYQITVSQYKAFCKDTKKLMPDPPLFRWYEDHPILGVNYYDALEYCAWLCKKYGGYWRLPTEAEWEFAARGGLKSQNYKFSGSNNWDEVGCNKDNSGGQTMPVGSKKPNELGIFDMSGNVWEWCFDWYQKDFYSISPTKNPVGPIAGDEKVVRGGGWYYRPERGRVSERDSRLPNKNSIHVGFRVVYTTNPSYISN